jgi:hypothetical protein
LAQFELVTDAAMTPVALTAPSTLSTSARAMAADIDGTYLYCAFREDMGGGVRLYRIDLATGLEDAFLDLTAVPTGASTSPAGLGLQGSELYVAAHDGASGTLAIVDLDTFTEVDTDGGLGGVQGVTLPSGAGPVAVTSGFAIVADPTASTATRVARSNFAILALDSTAGGASIDCVHTRDGRGVIQPLAGFDLDPRRPYVRRNSGGFTNANTREIFDLIGATSAATMDATALAELPTYSRFLLVLDGQIAVRLVWTGSFSQVDEDDIEDGVQAIDLTVAGPGLSGITVIGSVIPAFPPPGP